METQTNTVDAENDAEFIDSIIVDRDRLRAANACLIAALRDLLHEAAITANRIHNGPIDRLDAQTIVGNLQASSVIAHAAIAKATA